MSIQSSHGPGMGPLVVPQTKCNSSSNFTSDTFTSHQLKSITHYAPITMPNNELRPSFNLSSVPTSWQPQRRLRLLRDLRLDTIAFVTSRAPTAAVALAAKTNPGATVLVVAPASESARVHALGAVWADIDASSTDLRAWEATYRQSTPGSTSYWRFCHTRWLALSAALRGLATPADGAVVVLDDDVLLFERLDARLRQVALQHPFAHAETVVNGAFLLASSAVIERLAAFLWALYALPTPQLADVAWRFGESQPLDALRPRQRARIAPGIARRGRFPLFTDMDSITALRLLSRSSEALPEPLRVAWAAGHRRAECSHEAKATALLATNRSLVWEGGVPHRVPPDGGPPRPLCFVHLQGPAAKARLLAPMLRAAGVVA